MFVDYLTKWPEVFATADQTALTIANLFVQEIVCRHGVPAQLLSDRGKAFLSQLMEGVCKVLGVRKVNTTAYHPQTDGLVERFNRTLTSMLAKRVEKGGADWDLHLPYVLFAYQASIQESTLESPFQSSTSQDSSGVCLGMCNSSIIIITDCRQRHAFLRPYIAGKLHYCWLVRPTQ